ncbi:ABC transporter permease [Actinokineospora fastidiosa]|uniref:Transport permease protein n=1 Tax=Actinokineospora fastidiosa TaxID=1816 RepID=A0A918GLV3_9PSEU|nr:ABC transporter permease [Actinokineospora fastidiosa]GGS46797.1 transport permease protein [Actinokineospora fastidiosa]
MTTIRWTVSDGGVLVRREIGKLLRHPGELASELLLPAVLVLMFGYVFGSAISVPGGGDYREFLMPGLFAMVAMSGIATTATVVARDVGRGVMDRFRSMPMARSAVPVGHTAYSLVSGLVNFAGVTACALVVGWRPHNGLAATAAGFGLLFLFRYAVAWAGVLLGLAFRSEEAADHMVPFIFPMTMVANTFVPTDGMAPWLRVIADWNPVSAVSAACRTLWGNPGVPGEGAALPLRHPVEVSVLSSVVMIVVIAPIAVWMYQRAGRR